MDNSPIITPDPNGDRFCNQRWDHRAEPTTTVDGSDWCSVCYTAMNPTTP